MPRQIKRAAVLGAGVMGTGIAAHLRGMGIETVLLDIVPPDLANEKDKNARNSLALTSLSKATKAKPPVFHHPLDQSLIEVGNFDDDLAALADCDWIVEAVVERLDIKQKLFARIEEVRRKGSLITSNTSGLKISSMLEGRSEDFARHFFVTHFFNPVRFMRLLELVSGEQTDEAAFSDFARFGQETLGKGIVYGKDTPNFVGNRIGIFGMMYTLHAMLREGLSVEEVDMLFGPVSGRPKSAIFRTADLVGIDVLAHVANNCYENLPEDECRDTFKIPDFVSQLIERGTLGQKTKAGFYKKQGKEILAVDPKTLEYRAKEKVRAASVGAARKIEDVAVKVKTFLNGDDHYAKFAWDVTANTLIYSANRIGEICDDVVNLDRALRWGFGWDLGPFETWDALGVPESVERMSRDGLSVPSWVTGMLESGQTSFYGGSAAKPVYYDVQKREPQPIALDPKQIKVAVLKERDKVIEKNTSATLYDIDDGVLLVEFHSKMNSVDPDISAMLSRSVDYAEEHGLSGVVIGNDHKQAFSAGANLFALVVAINQKAWDSVEQTVSGFQQANMWLRNSSVPVVAAPSGLALGGGAEVVMAADATRAHTDLYMGLVEVGVGLIPAGGGTLRMLENWLGRMPDDPNVDPGIFVQQAFRAIAMATVSMGAFDAQRLGLLKLSDRVTADRDRLIHDAKQTVLGMAGAGYRPPRPGRFRLPGKNGAANLRWFVDDLRRGEHVSDHDFKIASKLAYVLCGGDTTLQVKVSEQQILDLEREAFLSLCGEQKTQERIQHMLTKGKPLRN